MNVDLDDIIIYLYIMHLDTPQQNKAESYLRTLLAHESPAPLPAIAGCAREAGVSYVTMWKAFASLRMSGELKRRTTEHPDADPKVPRWQVVREQIIRDIVGGRIPAGGQLTLKGTTADYGACYRIAKTAVDSLEEKGWLVREKKHFRVRSPVTGGFGNTVVLLSVVDRSKSVSLLSSRIQDLIRATEIHCSRMRLGLEPSFLREKHGAGRHLPAGPGVAGYLVWIGDLKADRVGDLLDRLGQTGKPVSILDETGDIPFNDLPQAGGATAFFSLANSMVAGRAMGRHLLGLGHRHIGFLSANKGHRWADNRYAGLCETFAAAGFGNSVRQFGLEPGTTGIQVESLMHEALADRTVTAWVAVTDALGIGCLNWLTGRGVRPGRDLSVAGFDDTPDAFLHSLTSYNFNCEATVHAMLAHLVGRRLPTSGKTKREIIEMEGFVTPRGSTGRVGLSI